MVWRLALCAVLAGGCDRVMQLIEVKDGTDGGSVDARERPVGCPADYQLSLPTSASYYKKLPQMAWQAAGAACAADRVPDGAHTHLVVLSDDTERQEATVIMGSVNWWIGLSDLHGPDDVFKWVSTEETGGYPMIKLPPWDTDQPDRTGPACVGVRATGPLHDDSCTDTTVALCECDTFADVPENR